MASDIIVRGIVGAGAAVCGVIAVTLVFDRYFGRCRLSVQALIAGGIAGLLWSIRP